MIIYILLPFLLIVLYVALSFLRIKELRLLLSALLPAIILFLILGFKGSSVGADSTTYVEAYYNLRNIPRFPDPQFFESLRSYNFKDEYGFIFLSLLFSSIGVPYLVFQIFIYSIVCFSLFFSTWKLSKNPILSISFFCCFTFFTFFISGLRQAFAISLCIMATTLIVSKGRTVWRTIFYFLLVGLATLWHKSAFIFVIPYFLAHVKIKTRGFFVLLFVSAFLLLMGAEMYESINALASYLSGGNYGDHAPFSFGKGLTSILVMLILLFVAFLIYPSKPKEKIASFLNERAPFFKNGKLTEDITPIERNNNFGFVGSPVLTTTSRIDLPSFFMLMTFIGVWLMFTNSYSISFGRINMYFSIFLLFLVPNAIESIKNTRTKYVVIGIFSIALIAYYVFTTISTNYLGIAPYYFIGGTV